MNIDDIINLFKLGKASAKSHIRNLIEIAAADGNLGVEEQRLLQLAAIRNYITDAELKDIQANPSKVPFKIPGNKHDRFRKLYDLVHMMSVDKDIHTEELRLCEIFAVRFGYRKESVREMINMIKENINEWIGPEETMVKVEHNLKIYE